MATVTTERIVTLIKEFAVKEWEAGKTCRDGGIFAFSKHLGVKEQNARKWYNGRQPSPYFLGVIARGCNVSVDWLLGLTEDRGA